MSFDRKAKESEIIEEYLREDGNRPWIIGYSGGKDSTTVLQLVWYALKQLEPSELKRPIYVVCNNTLVENPKVLEFVETSLSQIEQAAKNQNLPITAHQTTPSLEDSFWVNMIGKGYPAPNNMFRWCTERLKIKPTTKFILNKISELGEVIILLGTRTDESATRAKSMKKYEIGGSRLRKHNLPNAFVYAPVHDMTTNEVWQYLLAAPSPWSGKSNRDLVTLYGNASGGDCPLITDISTPSCGQSRFGCWVCTVVKNDVSMGHLIDNGEEWMEPLLELRDFLYKTIDRKAPNYEKEKYKYRMDRRRNGAAGLGPYHPKWRYYILQQVLEAQKAIDEIDVGYKLINNQELIAIQVLWHRDDIFEYNVSELYRSIFDKEFSFKDTANAAVLREKELLKEVCDDESDFLLINELLSLQKSKTILVNKWGLQNDLDNKIEDHVEERIKNAV